MRQVFYQAEVRGLIDKSEAGYDKVQRSLADMRRAKELPYDWIVDNTRWQRKPETYGSPADAIDAVARFYRVENHLKLTHPFHRNLTHPVGA